MYIYIFLCGYPKRLYIQCMMYMRCRRIGWQIIRIGPILCVGPSAPIEYSGPRTCCDVFQQASDRAVASGQTKRTDPSSAAALRLSELRRAALTVLQCKQACQRRPHETTRPTRIRVRRSLRTETMICFARKLSWVATIYIALTQEEKTSRIEWNRARSEHVDARNDDMGWRCWSQD